MVVRNRIAYLSKLARDGAKLLFTVSVNPATGVQKFRVLCDKTVQVSMDMQFSSFAMLDLLTALNLSHRVADRGHRHSNGISEVTFFASGKVTSGITTSTGVDQVSNAVNLECRGSEVVTAGVISATIASEILLSSSTAPATSSHEAGEVEIVTAAAAAATAFSAVSPLVDDSVDVGELIMRSPHEVAKGSVLERLVAYSTRSHCENLPSFTAKSNAFLAWKRQRRLCSGVGGTAGASGKPGTGGSASDGGDLPCTDGVADDEYAAAIAIARLNRVLSAFSSKQR